MTNYKRYTIKTKVYKDSLMVTIYDNHFDTHDYAFLPADCFDVDHMYSYSDVATSWVVARLKGVDLEELVPEYPRTEKTLTVETDGVFGKVLRVY